MTGYLHSPHLNGNGNGNGHFSLPLSRKSFQRSLPLRLGSVEDRIDAHDGRLDELREREAALDARVAALEAKSIEIDIIKRVELAQQMNDLFRLVLGKRRSQRRPATARR